MSMLARRRVGKVQYDVMMDGVFAHGLETGEPTAKN